MFAFGSLVLPVALAMFQDTPVKDMEADKDHEECCHPTTVNALDAKLTDRKSIILRNLHERMRASWAPFFGRAALEQCEQNIPHLGPDATWSQIMNVKAAAASHLIGFGEVERAIQLFEECLAVAESKGADQRSYLRIMKDLAMAYIRLGETQNCISQHNVDSCIFPLRDGAVHSKPYGATKAIEVLERLLEIKPSVVEAMWLLNIAKMQVADYPDGVKKDYRIPPENLASDYDIGRFYDIAPQLGVNVLNSAGGSTLNDFNNDGYLDILLSSMDTAQSLTYFLNDGKGGFVDKTDEAGLRGQLGGLNFVTVDYDNDGRLDILVLRGGWMHQHGEHPNSLLRQQPDGTFVDVTLEAGIEVAAPTQAAAFADIDLDGDLDLYVGYESFRVGDFHRYRSFLWRNKGDGTFEDITAKAGVENNRMAKGVAFGDYNNDRYPDLYVSNMGAWNRLYKNKGDGTFEDVAIELGVHAPMDSFATWFFDYNNDGHLDIFVTCYGQYNRSLEIASWYMHKATGLDFARIYENDGKGGFKDVSIEKGIARPVFTMGCNFGDLDNDGFQDIYQATGDPNFESIWPNVMYRNNAGKNFQDVTTSGGFGNLQKGHGISFGDIDNDGDQDMFAELGGALIDDKFWASLFENPGHGNHWVTVRLTGKQTNHYAFGARIKVRVKEDSGERDYFAFVGCNSSFGGNSFQEEMGLGKASKILSMEISWPVSGTTQKFENVPIDSFIHVTEGATNFEVEERGRIKYEFPKH